jgi:hypothetical protein
VELFFEATIRFNKLLIVQRPTASSGQGGRQAEVFKKRTNWSRRAASVLDRSEQKNIGRQAA